MEDSHIKRNFGRQLESSDLSPGSFKLKRLSEVRPRKVDWLWERRIPLGHLTIMDGVPGEGKSFITHALASRLSMGTCLPESQTPFDCDSLLLVGEDDTASTVRPWVEALGGDLYRIHVCEEIRSRCHFSWGPGVRFQFRGDLSPV